MKSDSCRVLALMGLLLAVGRAEAQCATSTVDAANGNLNGVINSYWAGAGTVAAGQALTTIRFAGARRGRNKNFAVGDLAIVMQMQDAAINSTNTSSYGDGSGSGSGSTNLSSGSTAGYYEYVRITAVTANSVNVTGFGANNGLIRSYVTSAATATQGARAFQIIRVPRYTAASLSGGGPAALYWDGSSGGVLAFDVTGNLNLNGRTMSADGQGFRGGAGYQLSGSAGYANTDYVNQAPASVATLPTAGAHASKGEGIAGSPKFVNDNADPTAPTPSNSDYPNGSHARGAPGNAGGGGTDADPAANDQNSGGGGGGGCGNGGKGGFNWTPTPANPATIFDIGGRGGVGFPGAGWRVALGGGGGAGTTNDGTGFHANGFDSSGAIGGGIILVRVGSVSGTGSATANGNDGATAANGVANDGAGGGGGGGSIVFTSFNGSLAGLTLSAHGGAGGVNAPTAAQGPHGPGGGGGGGLVYVNAANVTAINVSGGAAGTTVGNTAYGATAGSAGCTNTAVSLHDIPGYKSGAQCAVSSTAVRLQKFLATARGDGVLLRWQTAFEANNLGFNVYRESAGRRVAVTPELVAGAALQPAAVLSAGYAYAWRDPDGKPGDRYWLEDVDLAGLRTLHGPAVADGSLSARIAAPARVAPSALLSSVGQPGAGVSVPQPRFESAGLFGHAQMLSQLALEARPAVKLAVREEGWYRVTYDDLVAAGFNPRRVDPRRLQLYVMGQQRPMLVNGEHDGRFDPGDSIEFYGAGVDLPTTGDSIYWLTEGPTPGARIRRELVTPRLAQPIRFLYTVERRDRLLYFPGLRNDDGPKFFGGIVGSRTYQQTLAVSHLDPLGAAPGVLEVALQGATIAEHHVNVAVNGTNVGTVGFDAQDHAVARFEVPPALLREGDNTVSLARTGGSLDASLVDYLRLGYWRQSVVDGSALRLTAVGGQALRVDGFGTRDVRVMDVTNPASASELTGPISHLADGTWSITVRPLTPGEHVLLAFSGAGVKRPTAVQLNRPSRWYDAANAADLVIVTHRSLADAVAPLKALREQQGYRVVLVDIEDVYDTFSFGLAVPQALKDFLAHAKTGWRVGPRFVLLMGDADADARNYLGGGAFNLVPTKLVDTDVYEAATDDWFVDFNGDDLPDLAIGRLPARTPAEAAVMVGKVVDYDAAPPLGHQALLVADSSPEGDFEAVTQDLRGLLPWDFTATEVLRSQLDDATARAQVLSGINAGPSIVNFAGHGSINLWHANLLDGDDAPGLTNTRKPFFVLMTCLNGAFHDPWLDSLGESLLKAPNGGAAAVWASTAVTPPFDQHAMNEAFYQRLFGGSLTLGEAVAQAKAAALGDVRRSWVLFGDPTMRLR